MVAVSQLESMWLHLKYRYYHNRNHVTDDIIVNGHHVAYDSVLIEYLSTQMMLRFNAGINKCPSGKNLIINKLTGFAHSTQSYIELSINKTLTTFCS